MLFAALQVTEVHKFGNHEINVENILYSSKFKPFFFSFPKKVRDKGVKRKKGDKSIPAED